MMVSYQDVQRTIVRVVRSMQSRGYDVWFGVFSLTCPVITQFIL